MIVQCSQRKLNSIVNDTVRNSVEKHVHLNEIDLVIGQNYRVYGVTFYDGIPWYLLCGDSNDDYPTPYCSVFFSMIDASIEEAWKLSLHSFNLGSAALLPDIWADDGEFLEKLVDGNTTAIADFNKLKQRNNL